MSRFKIQWAAADAARTDPKGLEQPFIFSAPSLTDDVAEACADESVIKNLASIQIRICRGYEGAIIREPAKYTAATETILHEKAKKAMVSHTAK